MRARRGCGRSRLGSPRTRNRARRFNREPGATTMDNYATADRMIFGEDPMEQTCQRCGRVMPADAIFCAQCGDRIEPARMRSRSTGYEEVSERSRLIALLLCLFLGYVGVHRFYVGKIGTGVLWLLTGGLFGIGYV